MRFVVSLIFFKDRSVKTKSKKLKLDREIVFEMDV